MTDSGAAMSAAVRRGSAWRWLAGVLVSATVAMPLLGLAFTALNAIAVEHGFAHDGMPHPNAIVRAVDGLDAFFVLHVGDLPYFQVFADYWQALLAALGLCACYPVMWRRPWVAAVAGGVVVMLLALWYCFAPLASAALVFIWLMFALWRICARLTWSTRAAVLRGVVGIIAALYLLGALTVHDRWFVVPVAGEPAVVAAYTEFVPVGAMGDGDSGMRWLFKVGPLGLIDADGRLSRASILQWRIADEDERGDSFERHARRGRFDEMPKH